MALGIPSIFPPGRELQVNYDWVDIADSTGYVVYECFNDTDSIGTNFVLAPTRITGNVYPDGASVDTDLGSEAHTDFHKILDNDWDSSVFQTPRTIKGICIFTFSWFQDTNSTNNNPSGYVVVRLRKWDGSTETEIGSVQTQTTQTDNATFGYTTVHMTISDTLIKKGEQLRLTLEGWLKNSGTNQTVFRMAFAGDPQNAAQSPLDANKTRIIATIPFRIDV